MFGFVTINEQDLSPEELARYRAIYCGVCLSLRERSGQLSRLTLNNDLTFVGMVLMSLYEPEETAGRTACVAHPVNKRDFVRSEFTDYAADMTIVMAYHKMMDNWNDDRSHPSLLFAKVLQGAYERVKARYPRQCSACEGGLARIQQIEEASRSAVESDDGIGDALVDGDAIPGTEQAFACANGNEALTAPGPDAAAHEFGLIMAEVLVAKEDAWSDQLRSFGYELGRFIYMMDAAFDANEDAQTGSYNPFVGASFDESETRMLLSTYLARAADVFERLPLVQDDHILRSVLYAGVWQRFNAQKAQATAEDASISVLSPKDDVCEIEANEISGGDAGDRLGVAANDDMIKETVRG
jgi:hypothetical protein